MIHLLQSFAAWLEPPLEKLEQEYRRYYLQPDIRQAMVVGFIFIVGNLGLVAADYALFNQSQLFFALFLTRLALVGVIVGMIIALSQITRAQFYERFVFISAMFVAVMAIVIDTTRPANFLSRFMIYLMLIFAIYLVLPNTVLYRLGAATFVTCACIASMFALTDPAAEVLAIVMIVCLLVANWVGVYASARYYTFRRRQFQALREAHALNEKLTWLADSDPLTGIYNRRKFFEIGMREFARLRHAGELSVAVLDLDFFKAVNDSHGHLVGDQALELLTAVILREIRVTDRVGRLGGEEFGLLFPGTDISAALHIAERIRVSISECSDLTAILDHSLTVSIGVATVRHEDRVFDDLIRRADAAMYRAKNQGRNRVIAE